jgi:hypothetical protein
MNQLFLCLNNLRQFVLHSEQVWLYAIQRENEVVGGLSFTASCCRVRHQYLAASIAFADHTVSRS